MPEIYLRPAKKSDAADLALLDNIAGHGISLWFWQQETASGRVEHALATGRERMAGSDLICGWKNSVVAFDDDEIVLGNIASYVMPTQNETLEDIKQTAPVFAPVYELFEKAVGTWLIDSLAVYPQSQGRGIGRLLLEDSLLRARENDVSKAALVVEDTNTLALKLYSNLGFKKQDTKPFIEFDGPSETKEWLLMTAQL
ncbi:MAG: GNAT family N-acetyltransferase [Pseudomonadota bacterium]